MTEETVKHCTFYFTVEEQSKVSLVYSFYMRSFKDYNNWSIVTQRSLRWFFFTLSRVSCLIGLTCCHNTCQSCTVSKQESEAIWLFDSLKSC